MIALDPIPSLTVLTNGKNGGLLDILFHVPFPQCSVAYDDPNALNHELCTFKHQCICGLVVENWEAVELACACVHVPERSLVFQKEKSESRSLETASSNETKSTTGVSANIA